jgi:hypothetical protein
MGVRIETHSEAPAHDGRSHSREFQYIERPTTVTVDPVATPPAPLPWITAHAGDTAVDALCRPGHDGTGVVENAPDGPEAGKVPDPTDPDR